MTILRRNAAIGKKLDDLITAIKKCTIEDKSRLTVLLITNTTGISKLKPLVIGKYKHPRCFKNINMLMLSVIYKANSKHIPKIDFRFLNKLNIKEAIDFIGEVWEKVTQSTIANYEYLQNQNKINNLLLDIDISLEFDDNNIATKELLTDSQIIKIVLEENNSVLQNTNNESDNEETPIVSMKEDLTKFKKYVRIVKKMKFISKKQTKLDSIFFTDMSFETTEVDYTCHQNY
ncbi:hypothetical protein Glove_166g201 [Diversispora epigaea]|uniref:DDE-1 domain-containing protein n=1 Tax=Diversispora epigaea TaxID=1348612 RepID=A0A397IZF4_9GLOM|nr:hypothetical protein Glove_166g201 [Diversispora epigaea]